MRRARTAWPVVLLTGVALAGCMDGPASETPGGEAGSGVDASPGAALLVATVDGCEETVAWFLAERMRVQRHLPDGWRAAPASAVPTHGWEDAWWTEAAHRARAQAGGALVRAPMVAG